MPRPCRRTRVLLPTDSLNRASYNRIAAAWDQARQRLYGREPAYVDALVEDLPAGAAILDLGCGTGRPIAQALLARGFAVTGVDQAESLLERARARFPEAQWIESPIEAFDFPRRYAAVVCWDTLFHIPRERHAGILARIAAGLVPGGRVMLTVGGSAHPAFTDTMFGETFFYDSLTPEETRARLDALGFEPLIAGFMDPPTGRRDKGRYAIVARLSAIAPDGGMVPGA